MTTTRFRLMPCSSHPALFAAAVALASLLAACSGSDDPAPATAAPPAAVAPTITTPPAALGVTEGQSASFTVVAAGSAPLVYQWRRNGSTIAGASAATYTLSAATLADNAAAFSVVVSNSAGSVTSDAAVLTVNPLAVAPAITAQPAAVSVTAGSNASFSASVSGTPAPMLRWFIAGGSDLVDGAGSGPLAGATVAGAGTATLTLTAVPASANGLQLRLRATNSAGAAESNSAALTVNAAGIAISAASGGTVTSPDGKVRAIFPPNAFTADTVVTFTPVPALALPSGSEPFAEDFASFQPVEGGYYRLDFTGGMLNPNVEVEYGVQAQAPVAPTTVQHVRPLSPPPRNPPRVVVIRCADGRTEVYMGTAGADYDTARALLCSGGASGSVTVGPAVLIPPPSASLVAKTLARTGDDTLRSAISFSNGRSAFGFEGRQQTSGGGEANVSGLGIVAANGSISSAIVDASLIGFDGTGQLLAQTPDCRLAAFGQRVSSLLGAFISTTPRWVVQLTVGPPPTSSCLGQVTAAAPGPGGTWVVANGPNLDRYSSTGVATPVLRWDSLPQSDIRRQITYRRLAVDSAGNVWGAGELNASSLFACAFSSFGPCAAIVKLDPSGALLGHVLLSSALVRRPGVLTPMALTLDAAGNAYAAQPLIESIPGSSIYGVGRIAVSRIDRNSVTASWSVRLSNSQDQSLGEIAVNSAGQVFVGTAPNGIVYRLDLNGVETGVRSAGAPFARSVISGLSVNPAGTLTYLGDLRGTLDGATSATCIPPDNRPCVDIFLRRFDY